MKNIDKIHLDMVRNLAKSGKEILSTLPPKQIELLHMVVGISGESGELLDAVKKYTIYNKELDLENIIEELGDIEFYIAGLRDILSISREETLEHNINKLLTGNNARYAEGKYSDEQAQIRADKQ